MTPQLTIRAIEPADAPEWRRLWHDYLVFYETTLPEDVYAATFARLTSGAPGEYRGFLALLGHRPVGLAHYLFHRSCWSVADTCYLQDLYADPDVRGTRHRARPDRGGLWRGRCSWRGLGLPTDAGLQPQGAAPLRLHGAATPFIEYNRP